MGMRNQRGQRRDMRAVMDCHVGCRGYRCVCNGCRQRGPARAVDDCHVGSGGSRHARALDLRRQRIRLIVWPLAGLGLI